jgi:hypothetical protein
VQNSNPALRSFNILDGSPDAFLIGVNRRGKVLTSTGWERSKLALQAL